MENTEEGNNNPDWRDFETRKEGSLDGEKKNQTSEAVEHVMYEEVPVIKKIQLEYVGSADTLEKAKQEFVERQGVVESTLYCECGDVFESWEAAVDHIQEFRN